MRDVDSTMARLEVRLRQIHVGFARRQAILSSFEANLDSSIRSRRRTIEKLEAEIAELGGRKLSARNVASAVDRDKQMRRARVRAPSASDDADGDVKRANVSAKPVRYVRFSDFPQQRSADGLTWRTPLSASSVRELGGTLKDYDNEDVEFLLRRAGAIHGLYLWDKQGFDGGKKLKELRAQGRLDDLLASPEACGEVFDAEKITAKG